MSDEVLKAFDAMVKSLQDFQHQIPNMSINEADRFYKAKESIRVYEKDIRFALQQKGKPLPISSISLGSKFKGKITEQEAIELINSVIQSQYTLLKEQKDENVTCDEVNVTDFNEAYEELFKNMPYGKNTDFELLGMTFTDYYEVIQEALEIVKDYEEISFQGLRRPFPEEGAVDFKTGWNACLDRLEACSCKIVKKETGEE